MKRADATVPGLQTNTDDDDDRESEVKFDALSPTSPANL